jgi:hypothetical protein
MRACVIRVRVMMRLTSLPTGVSWSQSRRRRARRRRRRVKRRRRRQMVRERETRGLLRVGNATVLAARMC